MSVYLSVATRGWSYWHVPLGGGADHDARSTCFNLVTEDRGCVNSGGDSWVDGVNPGCGAVLCGGEGDVVEHQPIT